MLNGRGRVPKYLFLAVLGMVLFAQCQGQRSEPNESQKVRMRSASPIDTLDPCSTQRGVVDGVEWLSVAMSACFKWREKSETHTLVLGRRRSIMPGGWGENSRVSCPDCESDGVLYILDSSGRASFVNPCGVLSRSMRPYEPLQSLSIVGDTIVVSYEVGSAIKSMFRLRMLVLAKDIRVHSIAGEFWRQHAPDVWLEDSLAFDYNSSMMSARCLNIDSLIEGWVDRNTNRFLPPFE